MSNRLIYTSLRKIRNVTWGEAGQGKQMAGMERKLQGEKNEEQNSPAGMKGIGRGDLTCGEEEYMTINYCVQENNSDHITR